MNSNRKKTVLADFTEELSAAHHLDDSTFIDLYHDGHYFDRTAALKKEIIDNLNFLPIDRFNAYIKYVQDEIHEVYGHYNPDECIIGKWIEKFHLLEKDFPFYDNNEVQRLLAVNKKQYKVVSEETVINVSLMQLEFHWYAGHLEYLKMKRVIDELLPKEKGGIITSASSFNNSPINPYPRIFTSDKAYKIFNNLKSELSVTKTSLSDYSYVYHKMLKDGYIYDDYKQTEFVFFLLNFDIKIDRIKPWNQIGNKKLRDSIYLKAKNQTKTVS